MAQPDLDLKTDNFEKFTVDGNAFIAVFYRVVTKV